MEADPAEATRQVGTDLRTGEPVYLFTGWPLSNVEPNEVGLSATNYDIAAHHQAGLATAELYRLFDDPGPLDGEPVRFEMIEYVTIGSVRVSSIRGWHLEALVNGAVAPTVADDPRALEILGRLNAMDVYDFALSNHGFDPANARFRFPDAEVRTFEAFDWLAVGTAWDGSDYVVVVIIDNPSPAAAEENAAVLREVVENDTSYWSFGAWSERYEIRDITVDGQLTIGQLELTDGSKPGHEIGILANREFFFVDE